MTGRIYTEADLTAPVERTCDVAIVGSGAGGSVLAAGLAQRGLDVVMLEEGGHYTADDFSLQERDAFPDMYQERGARNTADLAITVLQGRGVGGSTTVNWTTCYRTPPRILSHWQRVHGLEMLTVDELAPHFAAVEERLNIHQWPDGAANANNQVIFDGAAQLGWSSKSTKRNVRGCANSGFCGLGCPVEAKQAMGITYIPDAIAAGMDLYANVRAERFELKGGRVDRIVGRVMTRRAGAPDGPPVIIRPKVAVSACGAINGPALLLRSGITSGGLVGRRTFLHPVVAMLGIFEHRIQPFYGAPQSAASHEFIDRGPDKMGFFMEAAPLQPMIAAVAFNQFGAALRDNMSLLPHANGLLALHVDGLLPQDDGGTVKLGPDGNPKLDYPVRPFLTEGFRAAHAALARLQLAAGAKYSGSLHSQNIIVRDEADLAQLEAAPYGAHEHAIFTAHQMGGCMMGPDAKTSVVDPQHRHHEVPNLFVVDGSVLPTSLGVNPSQTIYGLAHRAVSFVGEAV